MRVFIFGTKDFPDLDLVKEFVKKLPLDTVFLSVKRDGVNNVASNQAAFQQLTTVDYFKPKDISFVDLCKKAINNADEVYAFVSGFSTGDKKHFETDTLILYTEKQEKLIDCIIQPIVESEE